MHLDMNAYEYMRRCVQIDVWWACVWFYAFVSTCEIACLHTHVYTRVNVCLYMWVCIHRPMYLGIFLIKVYFCQALQCTSLIPAGRSLWVWYQHGLHWKFQDIQSYIEKPCFKKLINIYFFVGAHLSWYAYGGQRATFYKGDLCFYFVGTRDQAQVVDGKCAFTCWSILLYIK